METFTWRPTDYGLNEPPLRPVIDEGDNTQTQVTLQEWSLTFEKQEQSVALAIRDFLKAHNGTDAFLFTNSYGEEVTVVCEKWNLIPIANNGSNIKRFISVTVTFEQMP